jgi:hypothetical protein
MSLPVFLFHFFAAFFPECPTEDSNGCAWREPLNAQGQGVAFIALSDSVVIYRGEAP